MRVRPRLSVLAIVAITALAASGRLRSSGQATDAPKPKSTRAHTADHPGLSDGIDHQQHRSRRGERATGAAARRDAAARRRKETSCASLKKEHNGHLLELSGKMKGSFGPPTPTKSFGGVSVGISGTHTQGPNTPNVPSMPSFEVKAFKYVADCSPALPR